MFACPEVCLCESWSHVSDAADVVAEVDFCMLWLSVIFWAVRKMNGENFSCVLRRTCRRSVPTTSASELQRGGLVMTENGVLLPFMHGGCRTYRSGITVDTESHEGNTPQDKINNLCIRMQLCLFSHICDQMCSSRSPGMCVSAQWCRVRVYSSVCWCIMHDKKTMSKAALALIWPDCRFCLGHPDYVQIGDVSGLWVVF